MTWLHSKTQFLSSIFFREVLGTATDAFGSESLSTTNIKAAAPRSLNLLISLR